MLNNKKENISNNNKTNRFFEYNACGYIIRIKDMAIKSQDMEILKDNEIIGTIREVVSRSYNGTISVCYSIKGDLFDSLEEAIETLIYNLDK